MKDYIFKLRMAVRDYECDIEGIVNNANYLHYMEHTRHQFLRTKGVSFIELHRRGIDTVEERINVHDNTPLPADTEHDRWLTVRKEGVKYVFYQDIYRVEDEKLCVRATVEAVAVVNGRLAESPELDMMLK